MCSAQRKCSFWEEEVEGWVLILLPWKVWHMHWSKCTHHACLQMTDSARPCHSASSASVSPRRLEMWWACKTISILFDSPRPSCGDRPADPSSQYPASLLLRPPACSWSHTQPQPARYTVGWLSARPPSGLQQEGEGMFQRIRVQGPGLGRTGPPPTSPAELAGTCAPAALS